MGTRLKVLYTKITKDKTFHSIFNKICHLLEFRSASPTHSHLQYTQKPGTTLGFKLELCLAEKRLALQSYCWFWRCHGIYTFLQVISCNYVLQAALQWTLLIASNEEFNFVVNAIIWLLIISTYTTMTSPLKHQRANMAYTHFCK